MKTRWPPPPSGALARQPAAGSRPYIVTGLMGDDVEGVIAISGGAGILPASGITRGTARMAALPANGPTTSGGGGMEPRSYCLRERCWSRRRALAGVGAGVAGLALAGCSSKRPVGSTGQAAPQAGQTQPRPGGVFHRTDSSNTRLDPMIIGGGVSAATSAFSRLFRFQSGTDPAVSLQYKVEPDLALRAESPDAITWTVALRPDARFHDIAPVNGHVVEAEDVKATFTRFLSKTDNPNRAALGMLDAGGIETPSPTTVVFKLKYPYAPFSKTIASPIYAWIFPREALAGSYDPAKQVIGSGPFIMDGYTPDVSYAGRKNLDWFEKGRPYVDRLETAIIPAAAQMLAQFRTGNLDEAQPISPNDLPTLKQSNPKAVIVEAPPQAYAVYFQLGDPTSVFQDVRIRRAFSMAIDREAIGKAEYDGHFGTSVFLPLDLGRWALKVEDLDADSRQYYSFNPGEAKQLLAAAGASDLEVKFAWVYNGSFSDVPEYQTQAQTINNMLSNAGIKTNPVRLDFQKDFNVGGKGPSNGFFPKDMTVFAPPKALSDPDEYLYQFWYSSSGGNRDMVKDGALDAMIDKQRSLVQDDDRLKAVLDIQRYLAQKMYAVPGPVGYRYSAVQPWVRNYCPTHQGPAQFTETHAKLWLQK